MAAAEKVALVKLHRRLSSKRSISAKLARPMKRAMEPADEGDQSLQSIVIPCSVESLGPSCFRDCGSLSLISFESPSCLRRIESRAFAFSSLQSIVVPRNVQFIDGSAFCDIELLSCEIESESDIFIFENEFLIDILDHKLIRNFQNHPISQFHHLLKFLDHPVFKSAYHFHQFHLNRRHT
jgi:hypothetical protein